MYKQIQFILLCAAVLVLSACNSSEPETCPDCQDDDMADEPIADLPCGGADLQNDDLNCGECGNECMMVYTDPRYRAGTCSEGKCGPRWFLKYMENPIGFDLVPPPELTCEEVCAEYSRACVAQGCVGLTGFSCATMWGKGCSLREPGGYPYDFTGSCTEKVPWPALDSGARLQVGCCCQP